MSTPPEQLQKVYTKKCYLSSNNLHRIVMETYLLTEKTISFTISCEVNGVEMSASEKIRTILKRKGLSIGDLAMATGQSRQNLSNKLSRDNFTIKELEMIASALDCSMELVFSDNESGKTL